MAKRYQLPEGGLCYDVGTWSRWLYAEEVRDSGALEALIETTQRRPDTATVESLWGELFGRLYDFDVSEKTEPAAHAKEWASKLHQLATEHPKWAELHDMARGDAYAAGLAVSAIAPALLDSLPPLPEDPEELQHELDGMEQIRKAAKSKKRKAAIAKKCDALKERIEGSLGQAKVATEAVANMESKLQGVIDVGVKLAMTRIAEIERITNAFGDGASNTHGAGCGGGVGSAQRAAVRKVQADPKLRKMAELAGRFRALVRSKKKAKGNGPEEVHAVELGSDLRRLLPSERMMLGLPGLGAALVYSRMLDQSAQQYAVKQNDDRQRGPIVFVLDESGSMKAKVGTDGSTRDTWAKAVALAVMERCVAERRSFAIVHFDSEVTRTDCFAKPWESGMAAVIDAVSHFTGGGTHIAKALDIACEVARGEHGWKPTEGKADLVLVTDGADSSPETFSAQIKADLEQSGCALHTIGISTYLPDSLRKLGATISYTDAELASGVLPDVAITS